MGIYQIRIYPVKPTDRNPFIAAAVEFAESHPPMRWLDRLNCRDSAIAIRPMTDTEKQAKRWREMMWRYKTWESLIADEWEATRDMKWMEELYAASRLTGSLADIVAAREAEIKKDQEKQKANARSCGA